MQRRQFLAGLTQLPAWPLMAYAEDSGLSIGILPGTGKCGARMSSRICGKPYAQGDRLWVDEEADYKMIKTAIKKSG